MSADSLDPAVANPLHALHVAADAEFQSYGPLEIVSTFGEPPAEYAAVHKSCGLMDLPQRGILELTGKDRLDFLNRLLTQQLTDRQTKKGLVAGQGVYSFWLNTKGRIQANLNILERGDRTWLEMDRRLIESTRAALEKYLFTEQVKFSPGDSGWHELALHGPQAATVLAAASGSDVTALTAMQPMESKSLSVLGVEAVVWRDDTVGAPGYGIILPTVKAADVWQGLITQYGPIPRDDTGATLQPYQRRPMRPVGWAAFNAARIEAGRPLFGIDFDDTVLPAETGLLERAVSLTKGCYLGQEIVARMHARQQVARKIVGIRMKDDALPLAGTHIYDDQQNEIGGITSSTISPLLAGHAICLGIVKKPFFDLGTTLVIPAEGAMRPGTVVAVPFLEKTQNVASGG